MLPNRGVAVALLIAAVLLAYWWLFLGTPVPKNVATLVTSMTLRSINFEIFGKVQGRFLLLSLDGWF